MCIATTPARLFATRRTIDGSLMPETSFTIDAPASMAFEATAGFIVSIERGTGTFAARPRITGPTRRHSSSADTGSEPGLVDSPPMSTRSAPMSTRSRPWRRAASASKKRPPSENESGVTLRIPITRVRSRTISPVRWRQIVAGLPIAANNGGFLFHGTRAPGRNFIPPNDKRADHAGPVPPCGLPRIRGEGEGPEVRPGPPCIETAGKGGGSARLLRQRREAGRRESGERRQGRRRERRGRGGPGPYETRRPVPICSPELVPRRTGSCPGAHRVPGKGARRPGLRGPFVALRILQVLQGRGEGSPAQRTVPRNRRRIRRRGQGGSLRGRESRGEARLPLAHPRADRTHASPLDQGREGERIPLRRPRPITEVRDLRDGQVARSQGGTRPRPPDAGTRAGRLRAGVRSREPAVLPEREAHQGTPRGVHQRAGAGIRSDGGRVPRHVRLRAPRFEVLPGPIPRAPIHRADPEQARLPPLQRVLRAVPDHEGHGHLVQATAPPALRAHTLFLPRGATWRGGGPPPAPGVHDARLPRPRLGHRDGEGGAHGPLRRRLGHPRRLRSLHARRLRGRHARDPGLLGCAQGLRGGLRQTVGQTDPRGNVVRAVLLLRPEVRMELRRRERQGRGPDDGPDRHGERGTLRYHVHGRGRQEAPPADPPSLSERRGGAGPLRSPRESGRGSEGGNAADAARLALADTGPDRAGQRGPTRVCQVPPAPPRRHPRRPRRLERYPRKENPERGKGVGSLHRRDRQERDRGRHLERPGAADEGADGNGGGRPPPPHRHGDEGPSVPTPRGTGVPVRAPDLPRVTSVLVSRI